MVRVRFAPSPTGPLHMGGLRTALYNYLFAKKYRGKFILRIEDTDQSRTVEYAENYIVESLKWLNLIPDEGYESSERNQYKQSKRKLIYKEYANKLLENGSAYIAFDTQEELNEARDKASKSGSNWQYDSVTRQYMRNSLTLPANQTKELLENNTPYVIRIKTERNKEIKFNDLIRGTVSFNTNNIDDKILLKSDGMPTYHLANVVDDYLMNITHVIRGEEWLPSTPLHILLYEYLGIKDNMPLFAHLPLLLRPDGNGKLSKRDGEKYGFPVFPLTIKGEKGNEIPGYKELGFLPEAFINILALLGWNPGTDKEIYTVDELIEDFSIDKISKSGAKFNYQKCLWINHEHLKKSNSTSLQDYILSSFKDIEFDKNLLYRIIEVDKKRINLISEIIENYKRASDFSYVKNIIAQQNLMVDVQNIKKLLMYLTEFQYISENPSEFENIIKNFIKQNNLKFPQIGLPIRIATLGLTSGPSISEIYYIMGKEEFLNRIKYFSNEI